MIAVFACVAILIAASPAFIMLNGIQVTGLISITAAVALLITAVVLHASELRRFFRIFNPAAFILLLIPCVWMLLQIVPISNRWLTNPVWISASQALGQPLNGAISMDIGATLLSLAMYCAVLAIAVLTAIVTLNRPRAESILLLLTASAAVSATALIGFDLWYLPLSDPEWLARRTDAVNIAAVGVVLSCATAANAYEQFDMRKAKQRKIPAMAMISMSVAAWALFMCLLAIAICTDIVVLIITLFGAGILMSALAIRKWRLDRWGQAGVAAIGAVAVIAFFSTISAKKDADPTVALSTQSQIASIERMLSDTKLAGAGAGSFQLLLPIYRDIDQTASHETPTTAATIAIEMGRPFLWVSGAVALFGALVLFRRAMLRGRDYIYPSAGAGCLVVVSVLAFANPGILGVAAPLMIGVVCGLAFAQSKSASNRDSGLSSFKRTTLSTEKTNPFDEGSLLNHVSTNIWLRSALVLFGMILFIQASWIFIAEKDQPDHLRIPPGQTIAKVAPSAQANVRSSLWADSAFPYADQLWIDQVMELDAGDQGNGDVLKSLTQTLRYSPHRGDIWLIFAAMAERYKWPNYQPSALLKMSYYTAPNELTLFPLRLSVALQVKEAIEDGELQDMIRRDITIILNRLPVLKPALAAAYRSASPQGKAFADRVITEIDPSYLTAARAKYP